MQDAYLVALVFINAYFLAVATANVVSLHRATRKPAVRSGPFVSVIVPARNEQAVIGLCVDSLLSQDYADYEVIVVDDQSEDGTAAIVTERGSRDPRVSLVSAGKLPAGWLGKPHALAQGVAAARGEILLLTDADTVHAPTSVSWAVTNMLDHRVDLLSGYLRQEYGTFGESLIVPTMYAMMLLTPLWLLPRTSSPRLAFAIGQYVAVRAEALDRIGGFDAIRDSIVDDMSLARRIKACGMREVFLDASKAARCRLYRGYASAFEGISRSVYSALGAKPLSAFAVALIVLGVIVGPALSVLLALARLQMPAWPVAASVGLFAAQWALVTSDRRVPFVAFALYPFVFLDLLAILATSISRTGYGSGADWKGREVHTPDEDASNTCEFRGDSHRVGKARS